MEMHWELEISLSLLPHLKKKVEQKKKFKEIQI